MKVNKVDWISNLIIIFNTILIVFCGLSIVESMSSIRVSKLGIESIAPEVLKQAPKSFRLNLKVECPDFPVEEMMKTESWIELQNSVSAYAERLEILKHQNRQRSLWISLVSVVSIIGVGIFFFFKMKRNKRNMRLTLKFGPRA